MNHEKKKPRNITQIKCHQVLEEIQFAFKVTPVCGLVGPRQCGKRQLQTSFCGTH
jgi:ABC-type hemin transport system ATPase subunit